MTKNTMEQRTHTITETEMKVVKLYWFCNPEISVSAGVAAAACEISIIDSKSIIIIINISWVS